MGFDINKDKEWVLFSLEDRLDSFNYQNFKAELDKIVSEGGHRVALNLNRVQFLSLPSIKYFSQVAQKLGDTGGRLALVGTPEKLKRQIHIFASLKHMDIFRSEQEWRNTQL